MNGGRRSQGPRSVSYACPFPCPYTNPRALLCCPYTIVHVDRTSRVRARARARVRHRARRETQLGCRLTCSARPHAAPSKHARATGTRPHGQPLGAPGTNTRGLSRPGCPARTRAGCLVRCTQKKSRPRGSARFFLRRGKVASALRQRSHAAARGTVLDDVRVFALGHRCAQHAAGSTHARRDCPRSTQDRLSKLSARSQVADDSQR